MLFIDLRAAFYSAIVELATGPLRSQVERAAFYVRIGLHGEEAAAVEQRIMAGGVLGSDIYNECRCVSSELVNLT